MKNFDLYEILQHDIEDIKGLINYQEYGLSYNEMKTQSKGILKNLEDHIEELINKK